MEPYAALTRQSASQILLYFQVVSYHPRPNRRRKFRVSASLTA